MSARQASCWKSHIDPQVTVLGVIFQHSPAILLVPSRAGISRLSDLKGHRLMDSPSNPDVAAMLKKEGVDYAALPRVEHNGDPRDLISGKADAFVSYSTDEPFVLGQLGAPYRIFSPRAYGIDFYGDNLCTSAAQASAHPDRTRAFLTASLKGWDYALKHKEQIVDLILRQYSTNKTRAALMFEALQSEILIEPGLVPLGTQTARALAKHRQHLSRSRNPGRYPPSRDADLSRQPILGTAVAWTNSAWSFALRNRSSSRLASL